MIPGSGELSILIDGSERGFGPLGWRRSLVIGCAGRCTFRREGSMAPSAPRRRGRTVPSDDLTVTLICAMRVFVLIVRFQLWPPFRGFRWRPILSALSRFTLLGALLTFAAPASGRLRGKPLGGPASALVVGP